MGVLENKLSNLRVKELREITRSLDLKGRSVPKTKQSLIDFIVNAQESRVITKKSLMEEIKKYTPTKSPKRRKSASADLKPLMEQRSLVNLKKIAFGFGVPKNKKKDELIDALMKDVDSNRLKTEVERYPLLKKYQKKTPSPKPKPKRKKATPTRKPKRKRATKPSPKAKRKKTTPTPKMEQKIFKAKTWDNGGELKDIFESLARFKKKITFECSTRDGITVSEMDEEHVALMQFQMEPDNFYEYYCPQKFHFGFNVGEVSKRMKKVGRRDTITVEIKGDSLNFSVKKHKSDTEWEFSVPLLDLKYDPLSVPDTEPDVTIIMPSDEFYRMARELKRLGKEAKWGKFKKWGIGIYSGEDIFSRGSDYTFEIEDDEMHEVDVKRDYKDTILRTDFLDLFAKSKNLSKKVTITLANEVPAVVTYNVNNFTDIRYYLAPMSSY